MSAVCIDPGAEKGASAVVGAENRVALGSEAGDIFVVDYATLHLVKRLGTQVGAEVLEIRWITERILALRQDLSLAYIRQLAYKRSTDCEIIPGIRLFCNFNDVKTLYGLGYHEVYFLP